MKLPAETLRVQPLANGVDSIRDNQSRPLRALGEEVAKGAVKRPCEPNPFSVPCHDREGTFNFPHGIHHAVENPFTSFIDVKL
jgi:hypothetical protein